MGTHAPGRELTYAVPVCAGALRHGARLRSSRQRRRAAFVSRNRSAASKSAFIAFLLRQLPAASTKSLPAGKRRRSATSASRGASALSPRTLPGGARPRSGARPRRSGAPRSAPCSPPCAEHGRPTERRGATGSAGSRSWLRAVRPPVSLRCSARRAAERSRRVLRYPELGAGSRVAIVRQPRGFTVCFGGLFEGCRRGGSRNATEICCLGNCIHSQGIAGALADARSGALMPTGSGWQGAN